MPPKKKPTKPKSASSKYRKTKPKAKSRVRVPKPVFVVREEEKQSIPLIPVSSLRRDTCEMKFEDYKRGGMIGRGFFGQVYELCDSKKQCPYVLKVQPFAKEKKWYDVNVEDFAREIAFQRYVYDKLKLAPKIYDAWICKSNDPNDARVDDIGFVIMERMDGTLTDLLRQSENVPREQIKQILELKLNVTKLHKLGIEHGDLSIDNIFYKRSGKSVQLFFGDFGFAHERGGVRPNNASDDDQRLRKILEIMGY